MSRRRKSCARAGQLLKAFGAYDIMISKVMVGKTFIIRGASPFFQWHVLGSTFSMLAIQVIVYAECEA